MPDIEIVMPDECMACHDRANFLIRMRSLYFGYEREGTICGKCLGAAYEAIWQNTEELPKEQQLGELMRRLEQAHKEIVSLKKQRVSLQQKLNDTRPPHKPPTMPRDMM